MPRRFARRMATFAILFVAVMTTVIVALAWLIGTLFSQEISHSIAPAVALLVALFLIARLARGLRRATAPLGDLIEASGRVESGEVGAQVEVRGPREIRALAAAFNSMSARLASDTQERRRLLADVSHELRTPLTVIQGSIEAMLDGLYPADREHLERVLAETHQLQRLIDDLRTLSLTDAGALPLHREAVDLGALATEVVAGFEPQASAANVSLAVETDAGATASVDGRRVRQVIGNLISNALRHTPAHGHVTVRVRRIGPSVELEVADTGAGMDAEASEHAFERFWRSGDAAGAGLGLAIVRDLVQAHGGEVSLESSVGIGTVVRCRFPIGTG